MLGIVLAVIAVCFAVVSVGIQLISLRKSVDSLTAQLAVNGSN